MDIISRKDAKAAGLKFYYTSKACIRGGIAERRTSNAQCMCIECKKIFDDNNIKKAKAYNKKNKEKISINNKKIRKANPEKYKEKSKIYYEKNLIQVAKRSREYYLNNKEKVKLRVKEYNKANPHIKQASHAKRKAAKLNATVKWDEELTKLVSEEAYNLATRREVITGFPWEVDHMLPLQGKTVSGLHVYNNLQVIPASLNNYKKRRLEFTEIGEWLYYDE